MKARQLRLRYRRLPTWMMLCVVATLFAHTPIQAQSANPDYIRSTVAWSRNGQFIAVSGRFGVRVYRADLQTTVTLQNGSEPTTSIAWSYDSLHLAGAGIAGSIRIWNITTGRVEATLSGHIGPVNSVKFSHDNTRLASAGADGLVRIWDLAHRVSTAPLNAGSSVESIAWSSDDSRIASLGVDPDQITIWNVRSNQKVTSFSAYEFGSHNSLDWSADDKALIAAGPYVFSSDDGHSIFVEGCSAGSGLASALSADGKKIAVSAFDASGIHLCVYDYPGLTQTDFSVRSVEYIWSVDWSPDGSMLVSADGSGRLRLWNSHGQRVAIAESPLLNRSEIGDMIDSCISSDATRARLHHELDTSQFGKFITIIQAQPSDVNDEDCAGDMIEFASALAALNHSSNR